jgi:hypothetical protein
VREHDERAVALGFDVKSERVGRHAANDSSPGAARPTTNAHAVKIDVRVWIEGRPPCGDGRAGSVRRRSTSRLVTSPR